MTETQQKKINNLKLLRNERGLRAIDVGKAVGVTAAAITNYEGGLKKPRPETAKKLADFYGVTIGYVLGYEERPSLELANLLNNSASSQTVLEKLKINDDTPFADDVKRLINKNNNYALINNFVDLIVAGENFDPSFVRALKQFLNKSIDNFPYILNKAKNSEYNYLYNAWREKEDRKIKFK